MGKEGWFQEKIASFDVAEAKIILVFFPGKTVINHGDLNKLQEDHIKILEL